MNKIEGIKFQCSYCRCTNYDIDSLKDIIIITCERCGKEYEIEKESLTEANNE